MLGVKRAAIHVAGLHAIGEAPPTAGASLTGRLIGGCEVGRPIGSGGMGVVFEARQFDPPRPVAIKVMHERLLASPLDADRFDREIKALGRLSHPNIASVFGAGVHTEGPATLRYVIIERIADAHPITVWAKGRTTDDITRAMVFVCRAVEHAHLKNVHHRDLKPGNILVGADGIPKVIDFGAAQLIDDEAKGLRTLTGQPVGTPVYMSPEQLGDPSQAYDARSDVYAIGLVLAEALLGQRPFASVERASAPSAQGRRAGLPEEVTKKVQKISRDLCAVISRALEYDPARRYQNAASVAEDLERVLKREAVTARRPGPVRRLGRWVDRRPRIATAAAFATIAITAAGSGFGAVFVFGLQGVRIAEHQDGLGFDVVSRLGWPIESYRPLGIVTDVTASEAIDGNGKRWVWVTTTDPGSHVLSLHDFDSVDDSQILFTQSIDEIPGMPFVDPAECKMTRLGATVDLIADLVPDQPGEEVLVRSSCSPDFPTRIQIYRAGGQLLTEWWHPGHVSEYPIWNQADRTLIFVGRLNRRNFDVLSYERTNHSKAGLCIFTVRTEPGIFRDDWILNNDHQLVSYWVQQDAQNYGLWPGDADALDVFQPGGAFGVNMKFPVADEKEFYGVYLTLDRDGRPFPLPSFSDAFEEALANAPDPKPTLDDFRAALRFVDYLEACGEKPRVVEPPPPMMSGLAGG